MPRSPECVLQLSERRPRLTAAQTITAGRIPHLIAQGGGRHFDPAIAALEA